jgi:Na+/proline symporter
MPALTVSTIDIIILIAYVLGSRLIFGWHIVRKRRQGDAEAYFLGGRNIHWGFIGLSFYVSNMSGSTFVGLPGSGYLNGISVYHYEWLPVVILIIFITFILPFYLEARVFTAPQFLEKRYDHHAKHFFPRLSESALVRTGQAATIGFMFLAAGWAPQIARFPSIWQYLQSILSYITPPVVVIFMLGIFWRRGTARAATATLALGIPIGLAGWVLNEIIAVFRIQYLYACGWMTLFSGLIFVSTSLFTAGPVKSKINGLTWSRAHWRRENEQLKQIPWYHDYRCQSAALLALALVIVVVWW